MREDNDSEEADDLRLFELPTDEVGPQIKLKPLRNRVWTENKAQLVARYLKYFVFITKHGTYIDAFAGRQDQRSTDGWAAELVLGNEPTWLRHFYLFELHPKSFAELQMLRAAHDNRDIVLPDEPGDSNLFLPAALPAGSVRAKEATFCLLDQRTFECTWELCKHIAALKPDSAHKPEQFYFLAQGWLDRAFAGSTTDGGIDRIRDWWGRDDWQQLRTMEGHERALAFCDRFKQELRYTYAHPWPIFEREDRKGLVMYYMIHATDHPEAPPLMRRAYDKVLPALDGEQLELDFDVTPYQGLRDATGPEDGSGAVRSA